jgi:hypothetical protein
MFQRIKVRRVLATLTVLIASLVGLAVSGARATASAGNQIHSATVGAGCVYDAPDTSTTPFLNVAVNTPSSIRLLAGRRGSTTIGSRLVVAAEEGAGAFELPEGFKPIAGGSSEGDATVSETLAGKLGSIRRAPLPPGSPAWEDIGDMTLSEVQAAAQANESGFKTIFKLLTDNRFNKP